MKPQPASSPDVDITTQIERLILARTNPPANFRKLQVRHVYADYYRVNALITRDNGFGSEDLFVGPSWFVESDGLEIFQSRPAL